MNSHSVADLVRRFYQGWNNGSIDFADLVAEDIVNHQPEAEPEHGRQRFEEAVKGVMRAVPDSQWTVSDLLADGDRVAARTTWSGIYQAPEFRGVTVPGPARFAVEHVKTECGPRWSNAALPVSGGNSRRSGSASSLPSNCF